MNVEKGIEFLKRADPILGKVIEKFGEIKIPEETGDPFFVLAKSIIYQQLAGKAAKTIFDRFEALCEGEITPQKVQRLSIDKLKTAGLSERKANYLKDLARHFIDGIITPKTFPELSNEEITKELISVKGIGPWTAEMFLMFHLKRPDVFSAKDLGLHKGVCLLYNKEYPLTDEELIKISEKWSPYRTLACLYLWRIKDNPDSW